MPSSPDIVYVHHGAARVYDTVAAIRKAGYDCRYLAGYYYKETGLPERLLRLLGARRTLDRLRRRQDPELDAAAVERSFFLEAIMALEVRCPRLQPTLIRWRNRCIDRRGARRIRRLRPRAVISCDTHSLWTFAEAKRIGAATVLDQMTGHLSAANRVFEEERRLHPELADRLPVAPATEVSRCRDEALAADRILAPSDYVRATLADVGVDPAKIELLPYGADTAAFGRDGEPQAPPFRILYAGHIAPRKGILYLLDAMRRLGRADAELVLLGRIEGDGAWLAPYAGEFTHVPHLPHGEIPKVFRDAHVYVYPSLHEGSSVSIYEAMASGLPVIATANAGSTVRDGTDGYVVAIRDADAIAQRLAEMLDDPALRQRMGAAARDRAGEFTWDAYGARLSNILKDLIE
jgi:starch synthase